ncbi:hypothetical protein GO730_28780 [Spirosoma sp. HMF3257]|uniref:DUF4595 domain-containing protein n=1 Tax=Spirosoma telluris TaxID=2183553 RepID=A0A327NRV8_9BACT|nr:hypothetical protein [Spirosoma telluris]RAI77179.1 hypothetical protein HMF3257_28715 [Spirosoma telluris]
MRINVNALKPITLLLLISLLSCNHEAPLPKVAPIDVLITKQTSVYYTEGKRPVSFAFPTPDSVFFQNTTLYRERIAQVTYEYDDQKRIVNYQGTDHTYSGDFAGTYTYTAQTVTLYSNRVPMTPYGLNAQGYIDAGNTYDQNGHLIAAKSSESIIVNDNIIQTTITSPPAQTMYEYDLTKPNLPDPFENLYGKPSYNLPTQETKLSTYSDGKTDKAVTSYSYEYDERGLPKRRTTYFEVGSPTEWTTKRTWKYIVITDFDFSQ